MNKRCSKCGDPKELEELVKNKRCKDGRAGVCKECVNLDPNKNKNYKQWRKNNPVRVKELRNKWARNNRDKTQKAVKRWLKNNPERYKLLTKKYNKKRSETLHDDYVKSAIQSVLKIPCSEMTPEMIHVKREQLIFSRALKELRRAVR